MLSFYKTCLGRLGIIYWFPDKVEVSLYPAFGPSDRIKIRHNWPTIYKTKHQKAFEAAEPAS